MKLPIKTAQARLLSALLLLVVTTLLYWPGAHGGFAFDDYHNIVENNTLRIENPSLSEIVDAIFSRHAGPTGRPLSMLTFTANASFFGMDPFSFKVVNILIHGVNACLVFLFARLVFRKTMTLSESQTELSAFFVSLMFAFHPVHLTSVLYIVQRMTSLSSLFTLVALIVFWKARLSATSGRDITFSDMVKIGTCVLLSTLSKEIGILFFVYVLVLELFVFRSEGLKQHPRMKLFLGFSLFVVGLLLWYMLSHGLERYDERVFNLEQRLLTQARVIVMYAHMIFVPELSLFSLFHDIPHSQSLWIPPGTLPSVLAIILAVLCCALRRPMLVSFPLAWFLGGHLLESTILPLELSHEHRNYLPSIGLFFFIIFLTSAIQEKFQRGYNFSVAMIAIYTLLLAIITSVRVDYWSDPYEHSAFLATRHPDSGRVQYEFGRVLLKVSTRTKDPQTLVAATDAFEKAVELPNARPHLAIAAALILAIERDEQDSVDYYTDKAANHPSLGTAGGVFSEVVKFQLSPHCNRKSPELVFRIAGTLLGKEGLPIAEQQTVRRVLAVYYLNALGEVDHALEMLRTLYRENPLAPAITWQYADALLFHGEKQLATQVVSHLLKEKPWYFPLKERLMYAKLRSLLHAETVTIQ